MFPAAAPAVWAAASARHGQETPLSLACRLDKRRLLRALALHGVPAAGSMLAALQLADEAAAAAAAAPGRAAAAAPLPAGVTDAAEELALQRRQWTRLYGSKLPEEAAALPAAPGGSWPGKPGGAGASGPLRQGHESPSSVLGLPPGAAGIHRKCSEASDDFGEVQVDVVAGAGASHLPAPVKGRRGLFTGDEDVPPPTCSPAGPSKCSAEWPCAGEGAEKAGATPCGVAVESCSGRWRARGLLKVRPGFQAPCTSCSSCAPCRGRPRCRCACLPGRARGLGPAPQTVVDAPRAAPSLVSPMAHGLPALPAGRLPAVPADDAAVLRHAQRLSGRCPPAHAPLAAVRGGPRSARAAAAAAAVPAGSAHVPALQVGRREGGRRAARGPQGASGCALQRRTRRRRADLLPCNPTCPPATPAPSWHPVPLP